jgi:hypothetical protein
MLRTDDVYVWEGSPSTAASELCDSNDTRCAYQDDVLNGPLCWLLSRSPLPRLQEVKNKEGPTERVAGSLDGQLAPDRHPSPSSSPFPLHCGSYPRDLSSTHPPKQAKPGATLCTLHERGMRPEKPCRSPPEGHVNV